MRTSKNGIDLITHFEGVELKPYLCPAEFVTVGIGHVILSPGGEMLKGKDALVKELAKNIVYTKESVQILLIKDLEPFEKNLNSLSINLLQNEFDALISFCYNLGSGALQKSTLLKRIKAKEGDIKEAFLMWNKAGGKVLPGLVKRREAEATLFLTNKLII